MRIALAAAGARATLAGGKRRPGLARRDGGGTLRLDGWRCANAERAEPRREQSHLGLGLYIVRLVAEFHGGSVRALNLANAGGVRFEVAVPLAP